MLLELMFTAGLHVLSDEVAANFDLLHSLHYRSSQNSVFFLMSHLNSKCHIELCYLKHAGSNNIGRRQRSIQNSVYGGTTLSPTHCRNLLNLQRPQDCLYIHFFPKLIMHKLTLYLNCKNCTLHMLFNEKEVAA